MAPAVLLLLHRVQVVLAVLAVLASQALRVACQHKSVLCA